jgi:predicted Zn-dependent peptidase
MLRTPGFDEERLDIEKTNQIESMKQRNDDPRRIASREWSWLMRGEEHFSSRALTKTEVEAISREDLIAFHEQYWEPRNMLVTVSGDVKTDEILAELNRRFEDWASDGPEVEWPPPAPEHDPAPGVYHVEKDIPQSRVRIGHPMPETGWMDPVRMPLMVMNDILGGGGFTSRITNRIRSDEGLAYSAGSGLSLGTYWPGSFTMFFQTKNRTVALASQIALEEVNRIREDKVTPEELEVAKASFIDTFPQNFDSTSAIVSLFTSDEYEDRPHSYWYEYQDRVGAVSREDVLRVAKKHLSPEQVVMLIVGRWDEVAPGDEDGRASMEEFFEGEVTHLPLRDPLTLQPLDQKPAQP